MSTVFGSARSAAATPGPFSRLDLQWPSRVRAEGFFTCRAGGSSLDAFGARDGTGGLGFKVLVAGFGVLTVALGLLVYRLVATAPFDAPAGLSFPKTMASGMLSTLSSVPADIRAGAQRLESGSVLGRLMRVLDR